MAVPWKQARLKKMLGHLTGSISDVMSLNFVYVCTASVAMVTWPAVDVGNAALIDDAAADDEDAAEAGVAFATGMLLISTAAGEPPHAHTHGTGRACTSVCALYGD